MTYPLSSPDSVPPAAIEAAITSLRSGQLTMGRTVERFEQAFAAAVGAPYAVMVNSGSSANLLAVEAMLRPANQLPRWKVGDEVLVPALAWSTTVWPLVQLGLVPVFVDVDRETLAIDWAHASRMLSHKTRGAVLIHVLGRPAPIDEAVHFCAGHGLTLIEDCCESFGATAGGVSVGRQGLLGTFSHFFSHPLATIEGGTIITANAQIADDLRSMRSHGWSRQRTDRASWTGLDSRFCFVTTGYNVRPMELQAAIGLVQLETWRRQRDARGATAAALADVVRSVRGLDVPAGRWAWMNLPILVSDDAPYTRDAVMAAFEAADVETRPLIAGNLLRHPAMATLTYRRAAAYPVADWLMDHAFMIGCHGSADRAVAAVERACRALVKAA